MAGSDKKLVIRNRLVAANVMRNVSTGCWMDEEGGDEDQGGDNIGKWLHWKWDLKCRRDWKQVREKVCRFHYYYYSIAITCCQEYMNTFPVTVYWPVPSKRYKHTQLNKIQSVPLLWQFANSVNRTRERRKREFCYIHVLCIFRSHRRLIIIIMA